jgi:hypothetical protein
MKFKDECPLATPEAAEQKMPEIPTRRRRSEALSRL